MSELSAEQLSTIINYTDEQRAEYFFTQAIKNNQLWVLTDEHGCVMLNTEDEDCVPVWPNQTFAQSWATDEWQTCVAEPISLNKWFSRWSPGLADDELAIVVFPSEKEEGLVFYPDELEFELKNNKRKS